MTEQLNQRLVLTKEFGPRRLLRIIFVLVVGEASSENCLWIGKELSLLGEWHETSKKLNSLLFFRRDLQSRKCSRLNHWEAIKIVKVGHSFYVSALLLSRLYYPQCIF